MDWFRAEHELTEEGEHHPLADLAQQVGGFLGTAVAFLSGKLPHDDSQPK